MASSQSNDTDSSISPTVKCPTTNNNIADSYDWDALYEEEDEDSNNMEGHGSVIKHLISQIRVGMDLTKVVLPTFILERRSLLEMYADFFAHPDLFSAIPSYKTAQERMVELVRWYMSAFHAGRRSSVAKKPYNPILGETFLCHWNLDENSSISSTNANNNNDKNTDTNKSDSSSTSSYSSINNKSSDALSDIDTFSQSLPSNSLMFIAEQVSHHPPVSAFYVENISKRISCSAHIYTKSKFLGLSVGVLHIGSGTIHLLDHNEEYTCTFPNAYGRSILTTPWVELGGQVSIQCSQSGYSAIIDFNTKPFYGGKKHTVYGEIIKPNKEKVLTIEGEWNGVMNSKDEHGIKSVFVDTKNLPVIKKKVRAISMQKEFESRKVWKEVTRCLKSKDVVAATDAKTKIEQRQRDLLKQRAEKNESWTPQYFEGIEDRWIYKKPLGDSMAFDLKE